jgi:hypothetical protein
MIGPKLRSLGVLIFLVLAACSTPGTTTDIPTQINTATSYVTLAEGVADTCIALKIPACSTPAMLAGIAKAKQVADEALAEAKAYPIDGTTQDKISAALRVAMNAVLLFYSWK